MKNHFTLLTFLLLAWPFLSIGQIIDHSSSEEIIFNESFDNNENNWDLYTSDLSSAAIEDNALVLQSFQESGTSRYVFIENNFDEFSAEVKITQQQNTIRKNKKNSAGLLFGFKDWDNYWYFSIFNSYFEIGQVIEGIKNRKANLEFSPHINLKGENLIKVIVTDEKMLFSINGEIVYRFRRQVVNGNGIGVAISEKGSRCIFDDIIVKDFGGSFGRSNPYSTIKATGSGLVISEKGIIATNYHVVDGAKKISISTQIGESTKEYEGTILLSDKENDLALIQITDSSFVSFPALPYSVRTTGGYDLGSSIFTIGFPLALSGMGTDPKFSDGKVSAKSGYEGSINGFQTTIPVQPGNSGGPVFNYKGELLGIINSKIFEADNVSYGIKALYLHALCDSATPSIALPAQTMLQNLSLEEQVKILTEFVVLIKIS